MAQMAIEILEEKSKAGQPGIKAFEKPVPIIDPNLPDWETVRDRFKEIYRSKMLTNSSTVKELELKAARFLGVKEVVAVSSCTLGIVLTLRALGIDGEVIVPSFTFSATGHAVYWSGATPVFVDSDPETWNISIDSVKKAIGPETRAIVAVHIFGNPADVEELERIARENHIKLIFDAAHAFGATVGTRRIGSFGDAEIFSLSPTKLLTGSEGGLIATNDTGLAETLRSLRNYGHSSGYDCAMVGLNARMSEMHAAVAVEGIPLVDGEIATRERLAGIYREKLSRLPGIRFQKVPEGNMHTYKDFTIVIEDKEFGISRDTLCDLLAEQNIQTKKYFYPPLHWQSAYSHLPKRVMDVGTAEWLTKRVLTIPLYSSLGEEGVRKIADTIDAVRMKALNRNQIEIG